MFKHTAVVPGGDAVVLQSVAAPVKLAGPVLRALIGRNKVSGVCKKQVSFANDLFSCAVADARLPFRGIETEV